MEYKKGPNSTLPRLPLIFESHLTPLVWWLLAIAAWGVARFAQIWLDGFYARSKFPVPFYVGQTTFDAVELKGYYAYMIERGTLGIYYQTQVVDFVFMITSWVFLVLLMGASLRTLPERLRLGKLGAVGRAMFWIVPMAPVFDALENLASFVMLSNPTEFANAWVYPYSTFAVLKFALFATGYLWAAISLILSMSVGFWTLVRGCVGLRAES